MDLLFLMKKIVDSSSNQDLIGKVQINANIQIKIKKKNFEVFQNFEIKLQTQNQVWHTFYRIFVWITADDGASQIIQSHFSLSAL